MPRFHLRRDSLERCLHEHVEAIARRAEGGTGPSAEEMSSVQAWRELIGVRSIVSGRARRVWHCVVLGVGLILGLLLLPVRTVGVDGFVHASSVDVVMNSSSVVTLNARVSELRAAGYTRVTKLPGGGRGNSFVVTSPGARMLELEQVTLPAGATVRVQREENGRLLLRVEHAREPGQVLFSIPRGGRVSIGRDTLVTALDTTVTVDFDAQRFDMQITPAAHSLDLLSSVPVSELHFTAERVAADRTRQDALSPSTIESGSLVLPALKEKITLRAREWLELGGPAMRVHRLRSDTSGVIVEFRARASRLALGEDVTRRSLKPTYLEWLAASRRLTLVWTVFPAILGIIVVLIDRRKRY